MIPDILIFEPRNYSPVLQVKRFDTNFGPLVGSQIYYLLTPFFTWSGCEGMHGGRGLLWLAASTEHTSLLLESGFTWPGQTTGNYRLQGVGKIVQ